MEALYSVLSVLQSLSIAVGLGSFCFLVVSEFVRQSEPDNQKLCRNHIHKIHLLVQAVVVVTLTVTVLGQYYILFTEVGSGFSNIYTQILWYGTGVLVLSELLVRSKHIPKLLIFSTQGITWLGISVAVALPSSILFSFATSTIFAIYAGAVGSVLTLVSWWLAHQD